MERRYHLNARRLKCRQLWAEFLKQDFVVEAIEGGMVRLSAGGGHRIEIHFPGEQTPFGTGTKHRFLVKTLPWGPHGRS